MTGEHGWILPRELLENSPSRSDGVSMKEEKILRFKTTWFLEEFGQSISSSHRLVVSTACVLFHRFFALQSFRKHDRFIIATTCLFLAGKVEETPVRIEHIIDHYIKTRAEYSKAENLEGKAILIEKVKVAERKVLHSLCFDLVVQHPYSHYKKAMTFLMNNHCLPSPSVDLRGISTNTSATATEQPPEPQKVFREFAVRFLHDSFRTALCLSYPPQHIGLCALYLTILRLKCRYDGGCLLAREIRQVHRNPPLEEIWYLLLLKAFDQTVKEPEVSSQICSRTDVQVICNEMLDSIEYYCHSSSKSAKPPKNLVSISDIQQLRKRIHVFASYKQTPDMDPPQPPTLVYSKVVNSTPAVASPGSAVSVNETEISIKNTNKKLKESPANEEFPLPGSAVEKSLGGNSNRYSDRNLGGDPSPNTRADVVGNILTSQSGASVARISANPLPVTSLADPTPTPPPPPPPDSEHVGSTHYHAGNYEPPLSESATPPPEISSRNATNTTGTPLPTMYASCVRTGAGDETPADSASVVSMEGDHSAAGQAVTTEADAVRNDYSASNPFTQSKNSELPNSEVRSVSAPASANISSKKRQFSEEMLCGDDASTPVMKKSMSSPGPFVGDAGGVSLLQKELWSSATDTHATHSKHRVAYPPPNVDRVSPLPQ